MSSRSARSSRGVSDMKNQTQSVPENVIDVNEHPWPSFLGIPPGTAVFLATLL